MYYGPPKCVECGRFMRLEPGASWAMRYDGGPIPMPDHADYQCVECTRKYGPLRAQAGIRETEAGVIEPEGERHD